MAISWQAKKYPVSTEEDLSLIKTDLEAGENNGWETKFIVRHNGHVIIFAKKET